MNTWANKMWLLAKGQQVAHFHFLEFFFLDSLSLI